MLGFGAIGVNPVATGPRGTGVVAQAMLGIIAAKSYIKVQASNSASVVARSTGSARLRASMSPASALSAKSEMMLRARAPGGVALKSIVAMMAKAKVTPGYLLFARAAMASSALGSLHMEGTTTPDRLPLLLNSGSQYGASYWRGRG